MSVLRPASTVNARLLAASRLSPCTFVRANTLPPTARYASTNSYPPLSQARQREESSSNNATSRSQQPREARPRTSARPAPKHFITLADLSPREISDLLQSALALKLVDRHFSASVVRKSLYSKTIALMFSKRSTRTRVASETSTAVLGGHAMFLGSQDIQLGVNESLRDTAQVVGSMVDGIMARVGQNQEVLDLAQHSPVPVINALSHAWHPTQILADLLTLYETYSPPVDITSRTYRVGQVHSDVSKLVRSLGSPLEVLKGKKIAWVGDMNNVSWELMATCTRVGMEMSVAAPKGYDGIDEEVLAKMKANGTESAVHITNSPAEALKDADIVVTDTWISMGQEEEKAARLAAFEGYQVTNAMVDGAGAKPDWKFLHCLPRHQEEVDDEVFYGPRSLVFPEAENRKWTIMAVFDKYIGNSQPPLPKQPKQRESS